MSDWWGVGALFLIYLAGYLVFTFVIHRKRSTHELAIKANPDARAKLRELQSRSGAKSLAEVVRRALALYDFAVTSHADGYALALVRTSPRGTGEEPIEVELFPDGLEGEPLPDNVVEMFPRLEDE